MGVGRDYSGVTLTHFEVLELLDSELWIRLATRDRSGQLWNTPAHFVRIDNSLFFDEDPDSIIVQNIEVQPDVCAVSDSGISYDDVKGAILNAGASIVTKGESIDLIRKMMHQKYKNLEKQVPPFDLSGRTFIKLELVNAPESISWSYGKKLSRTE